jgi:hypothetical protein
VGALSLDGVMKPKPFLLENHLTVPLIFVAIVAFVGRMDRYGVLGFAVLAVFLTAAFLLVLLS